MYADRERGPSSAPAEFHCIIVGLGQPNCVCHIFQQETSAQGGTVELGQVHSVQGMENVWAALFCSDQ